MAAKPKVLFLCTGNTCRSQMAEGFARSLLGGRIEAYSAGSSPSRLDPCAVRVMKEAGVDISRQKSKHFNELKGLEFDYVVNVCSSTSESCPFIPAKIKVIHNEFDDPPELSQEAASEEAKLGIYRRVRDEIRDYIESLPGVLEEKNDEQEQPRK
ncbi:MAG: arsenate reductase ArsC [Syntrophales bacterium]|nr:arsenate reductase ArsC [Syntrophales bacterium]MDY0044934.1 arsenate reductase ArsC [Syntrophales bacterium]